MRITKEAMLYEKLPEGKVRCNLCAHRCVIADGKKGICQGSGKPGRNSLYVGLWAYYHPARGPSGEETTVSFSPRLNRLLHSHSRM